MSDMAAYLSAKSGMPSALASVLQEYIVKCRLAKDNFNTIQLHTFVITSQLVQENHCSVCERHLHIITRQYMILT